MNNDHSESELELDNLCQLYFKIFKKLHAVDSSLQIELNGKGLYFSFNNSYPKQYASVWNTEVWLTKPYTN